MNYLQLALISIINVRINTVTGSVKNVKFGKVKKMKFSVEDLALINNPGSNTEKSPYKLSQKSALKASYDYWMWHKKYISCRLSAWTLITDKQISAQQTGHCIQFKG